jgi:hypothetical protein
MLIKKRKSLTLWGESSLTLSYTQSGKIMSDLDRGIMKFKGADNPVIVLISSIVILGAIGFLIWWALQTAYSF